MNNPHVGLYKIVYLYVKEGIQKKKKEKNEDRKRIENPYDRFKSEGVASDAFAELTLAGRNVAAPNPPSSAKIAN